MILKGGRCLRSEVPRLLLIETNMATICSVAPILTERPNRRFSEPELTLRRFLEPEFNMATICSVAPILTERPNRRFLEPESTLSDNCFWGVWHGKFEV